MRGSLDYLGGFSEPLFDRVLDPEKHSGELHA